ncbi:hypothetical protein [[Phormidium ambiguum] IAM M-71]|uniref:hypothetical protein n=1 Tax=[Phormidium ambiguum] IAM M-71 TaxID=454136 RepID=UPI0015BC375E|nr:hypothetical protein [Phormidium ambiguum]
MIRKPLTKQAPKTVLDSDRLPALVTDLAETQEGAIVGGKAEYISPIRSTFTF